MRVQEVEPTYAKSGSEIVPLLNLEAQYISIKEEIDAAIRSVVERQHFILGEQVAALEEEIASYCGVRYGVGVASGTDALLLALKAAGVGRDDEVIVPAFSFVATADVITLLGAIPVFADIDPVTYNLDADQLEKLVTRATRAVIPVHLYGQPAEMRRISKFAKRHGLALIGDAAQALGATYGGDPVCSFGNFGCISFFPSKNLGAYGDGGMIVTNDESAAASLKMLRSHGSKRKYHSEIQGWNSRLDELQAGILRAKLPYLDSWNRSRARVAALYDEALRGIEGVVVPAVTPGRTHVYHQYTLRVPCRNAVQQEILRSGVQTAVHYPVPLHLQPMFRHLGYRAGELPVAEKAASEVLSLPIYPELSSSDIERICHAVKHAVESQTIVAGWLLE